MITNPYLAQHQRVHPDSRLLRDDFGLIGVEIDDGSTRGWTIQGFYEPAKGRALGGLRIRVADRKGFVSFVNQRDLEVLLAMGRPGQWCPWLRKKYAEPRSPDWYGICGEGDDFEDDLLERELLLRAEFPQWALPIGLELTRRIHVEEGQDYEELLYVREGFALDTRLCSIQERWTRIERRKVSWRDL